MCAAKLLQNVPDWLPNSNHVVSIFKEIKNRKLINSPDICCCFPSEINKTTRKEQILENREKPHAVTPPSSNGCGGITDVETIV